jgi:serine/threonine protein phosphatase PrpC
VTQLNAVGVTNKGRKRRGNEDSYVCEPPLFAVADGMGGAQAGEIASRLAAGALREETADGLSAEERVVALVREANRRVFEGASEDRAKAGMGTTVTVAVVNGTRVTFGHVGDSRAYLMRDGAVEQLTNDHSLVAELVRSGKLSPEEAESHPQRSVITRALGTEPDVDVDTFEIDAQPGDLFLICSDGLTSMIDDTRLRETLARALPDLDRAAHDLVDAANRAGGEDNITVVLFELARDDGAEAGVEATRPMAAVSEPEPLAQDVDEDTLDETDRVPAIDTMMIPAAEIEQHIERSQRQEREDASYGRRFLYSFVALALLVLIVLALLWGFSRAHFVGAEGNGHVAVYRGLPYDVVGDIRLYRPVYVSNLHAAELTRGERRALLDHSLQSEEAARADIVRFARNVRPT